MKKLLALMLALVMVFALAACGNTNEQQNQNGEPPASDPGSDPNSGANSNILPEGAYLLFEDVKDGGAITITWALTLKVDGSFALEEQHPMAGSTEHAGASYSVSGDTVTCTGLDPFPNSDIFNVDSFTAKFNEQFFAPTGYALAEPVSDHQSDYVTVPGTYAYEAYKADFDFSIYWTLELKDDGSFTLTEDNSMLGNIEEHAGASWEADGDIVSLHGLEPFGMDDIFKKTDVVVITFADMTFIPKEALSGDSGSGGGSAGGPGGGPAASSAGGSYTFTDVKEDAGISFVWTLTLNEDGSFSLTEDHPMAGLSTHDGAKYTVDGDSITLEGLDPFPMSDVFNVDTLTVKFNEAHFAPEGKELEKVTVYTFEDVKADTGVTLTWELLLKDDGSVVLTEINPNFGDPKVYHGSEYTADGNTVKCGPLEDAPGMNEWAFSADGFTVTLDPDALTFEPVV